MLLVVNEKSSNPLKSVQYEGREWYQCPACEAMFDLLDNMQCPGCGATIRIAHKTTHEGSVMFCKSCRQGRHRHHEKCTNTAENGQQCKCRVCDTQEPDWRGMYSDRKFVEDIKW